MAHNSPHTLHRALLTPFILTTLRATGFHSTRPSVLDTLVDIAERYMLLLATSTAEFAFLNHNTPVPTITDVRMAMEECGAIVPVRGAQEEQWREVMRRGLAELGAEGGGPARVSAEGRRRDERDLEGVNAFTRWFDGPEYAEILRVAGATAGEAGVGAAGAARIGGVGAGGEGGKRKRKGGEDFLTLLKKRYVKMGGDEEARWVGTVLGKRARVEDGDDVSAGTGLGEVVVEGGPVQRIRDWRPPKSGEKRSETLVAAAVEAPVDGEMSEEREELQTSQAHSTSPEGQRVAAD